MFGIVYLYVSEYYMYFWMIYSLIDFICIPPFLIVLLLYGT